eukprot:GEMP01103724.1.p1 GENE.GEMP01103724.1~~GEMP01103724.1.p1  ORF type:complete len:107 (+),score=11.73 GEMP01103724.1:168-488(+)
MGKSQLFTKNGYQQSSSIQRSIVGRRILGTPEGEFVSMGVTSDGNPYSIAPGLTYSLPCVCKDGRYFIVHLKLPRATREHLRANEEELMKEREMIECLLAEDLSVS